jgi:CubicO group peptidase (beta-lactamase class C family)
VADEQRRARLPSLVAGVVRDHALVWAGSHGDHTGAEPPAADTQYRIGSITKTMTAVLVLQLRDDGLLELGDRLADHLPGVAYGDRTLRGLLAHSSGMQSEPPGPWWERSPGVSFEQLADALDDTAAAFEPGSTYHYTNLGYGLLGEVVVRLRGGSWWEQVRTRILQPLGMTRTSYLPEPPHATGYSVHHFAQTLTEEPAHDTGAMAPAGQLWSTVEDLARYATFLLEGHADVLSPATLREMCTPQSGSFAGGATGGYGLGVRLLAGGSGTLAGHTGSMPGFLAGVFVDRGRRTAAVCLANGTSGLRCEGLPAALLDTLEECEPTIAEPWRPADNVPAAVEELLGVWHWGNTAYGFSYDDGEVAASQLATGMVTLRFRPEADGSFVGTTGYHHGERLHVVRHADGSVSHLVCATFVYTRAPYDPSAPIPGGAPSSR